jgi:hypothetical protein
MLPGAVGTGRHRSPSPRLYHSAIQGVKPRRVVVARRVCYTPDSRTWRERTVDFFGIGAQELFVLLVLAVVLFGERLPEVARSAARIMKQLRAVAREFQDTLKLDD